MSFPLLRGAALVALMSAGLAASARAHFVWIQANVDMAGQYSVHFGDGAYAEAEPQFAAVLKKHEVILGGGEVFVEESLGGQTWQAADPNSPVGTSLTYGLFGGGERRSVLRYHAKGAPDLAAAGKTLGQRFELTVRPAQDKQWLVVTGMFDGAPAAGAELVFLPERARSSVTLELDDRGQLQVPAFGDGPLQLRAGWKESVGEIEFNGETVSTISHYATLLVSQAGPTQALADGSERWAWQRLRRANLCMCAGVAEFGEGASFTLTAGGTAFEGSVLLADDGDIKSIQWPNELPDAYAAFVGQTLEQWFEQRAWAESGRAPQATVTFGSPHAGASSHSVVALSDPQQSRYWLNKDRIERLQQLRSGRLHTLSFLDHESDEEGNSLATLIHEVVSKPSEDGAGELLFTATHRDSFRERDGFLAPTKRRTEIFRGGRIESLELSLSWAPRD